MREIRTQSTVEPSEWDLSSSPTEVYHNQNVVLTPAHDDIPAMYDYDQTIYTRAEYGSVIGARNRADTDYIAIMCDIDLEA